MYSFIARDRVKSGPFSMSTFRTDFSNFHRKKYTIPLTISNRSDSEVHSCKNSICSGRQAKPIGYANIVKKLAEMRRKFDII